MPSIIFDFSRDLLNTSWQSLFTNKINNFKFFYCTLFIVFFHHGKPCLQWCLSFLSFHDRLLFFNGLIVFLHSHVMDGAFCMVFSIRWFVICILLHVAHQPMVFISSLYPGSTSLATTQQTIHTYFPQVIQAYFVMRFHSIQFIFMVLLQTRRARIISEAVFACTHGPS